jgi:glycosyltransferase involved in cell wall biosynthesis
MIGQKGIPARFGGVETHVEQLSTRLARRGHEVWVFCRSRLKPLTAESARTLGLDQDTGHFTYKDVHLKFRSSINTKHFDAATHTLFCAAETALRPGFDIVHFHGIGPSAFVPIPRLTGRRVVATIHALDWRQTKWGRLAKRALRRGEATGIRMSHGVIAVSTILESYIKDRYGVRARYIPNGATPGDSRRPHLIERHGLRGDDYILTVGRIIPERGLHYLIEAFKRIGEPLKLVIVGSESPRTAYSERLEAMADEQIIFTGDIYGEELKELYSNCRLFVLASDVEGLPVTVCEAMAHGKCVLLSDIPENLEVGGEAALYFKTYDSNSLYESLDKILKDRATAESRGQAGYRRIRDHYNWDRLAELVEGYYYEILG